MMNLKSFAFAALIASLAGSAFAAPVLKSEVTVLGSIVTVGDMFEDAGELAGQAMFRSPAPGTTGTVTLDAVKQAAELVGLGEYAADGVLRVRVARSATLIDAAALTRIITSDLASRGIVSDGVVVDARYEQPDLAFNAERVADPVQLVTLRYTPGNGAFAARFLIAGKDEPVDVAGRIELLIEAPHLIATRAAGTILTPSDIEMKPIPLRNAEASGVAALDQLVGKQLTRQSRGGMMLKPTDVTEPRVVERNAMVTVILSTGPMTLTVKGQALNNAAEGQQVQVINTISKKILVGTALSTGAVAVTAKTTLNVAGL